MRRLFWRIYIQPLSTILAAMLLLLVFWTVLARKVKNRTVWKLLCGGVFLGITAAILYVTLLNRREQPQAPEFIPFHTFVEAKLQPELYRAMLMNIFLFQPLGLSLPGLLPQKKHPVARTILFALLLSVGIEVCQLSFGLGRCEIDDVIMNTLGAALGTAAYARWRGGSRNA